MFARFDENPAMTLRVIKETKRYGRTDGWTDARTDARTDGRTDNVKTVYPLQTKFAGGIIIRHVALLVTEISCQDQKFWIIPRWTKECHIHKLQTYLPAP